MDEPDGDLTDDEFQDLREAFQRAMREHPFNVTVLADPTEPELQVRKMTAFVPVSDELLHPERYPALASTRRARLRWWWWEFRDRVLLDRVLFAWEALRVGRAGVHADCDY